MTAQEIRTTIYHHKKQIKNLESLLQSAPENALRNDITIVKLTNEVCKAFSITPEMLRGKSRPMNIVNARATFTHVAYSLGYIEKEIAGLLQRDRSSICHLKNDFEQRVENYPEHRNKIKSIVSKFI